MKHPFNIITIMILLFIFIQIFGLFTVQKYDQTELSPEGDIVVVHQDTVFGEQPEIQNKDYSFVFIIVVVLFGTALIFLLIKFSLGKVWRYGFVAAVFFAISIALGVYINEVVAVIIALLLAGWKVFKPNFIIHNLTEILIYPGITIVLLPFFNILSISILLVLISAYDIYAVNKSKHMIKLAKFQTNMHAFAGLFIPYSLKTKMTAPSKGKKIKKTSTKKLMPKSAILGGGDIAFPLIFTAVVYESFLLKGFAPNSAFLIASIISITSTIALIYLLYKSEKGKFYPAMPILSAGCFIGLAITYLF